MKNNFLLKNKSVLISYFHINYYIFFSLFASLVWVAKGTDLRTEVDEELQCSIFSFILGNLS